MAQQPGLGIAGVDAALDPDNGRHVRVPAGVGQTVGGVKDGTAGEFALVRG